MTRRAAALLAAVGLTVLLAGAAGAQPQELAVNADTDEYPDVSVTVPAPRQFAGQRVPPEAFALTEGGQPRDVTVVPVPNSQLEVVLVIDTSGSMAGEPLAAAKAAATSFVEQMPPGARMAVMGFSDATRVVSRLTEDRAALPRDISSLEAGGKTALYDAVAASLRDVRGRDDAQRTVVLLSDGADTRSTTTMAEASRALRDAGAGFYAIQLHSDDGEPARLSELASAANGRVVPAAEPGALAAAYQQVAQQVVDQYRLTYRSRAHGPAAVTVEIGHGGVHAVATGQAYLPYRPYSVFDPVILSGRGALIAGAVLAYLALTLTVLTILDPGRPRAGLGAARRPAADGRRRIPALSELAAWASELAEHGLQRHGWRNALNLALERAGLNLRAGEFVVLCVGATLTAGAAGLALQGPLLGLLLAAATVVLCRLGLSVLADRRQALFADQLADALQLLAGGLRAGYSIMQATDAVSREAEPPTGEEFRRLVMETRLGRDLNDALMAMARRVSSEDFEWVVQAIAINRDVGGDLAKVLDTVANTIRERNQLRRQVKALSAEGRISGVILVALPFTVAGLMLVANPAYLRDLVIEPVGRLMLGTGAVLMALGALWIRKLARVAF